MIRTWSQGSREPLKMILRPLSLGSVDTGSISLGSPNLSLTPPLGHLLEIGGCGDLDVRTGFAEHLEHLVTAARLHIHTGGV